MPKLPFILGCDCPEEKQDNVTSQQVFCYIQLQKSSPPGFVLKGRVCWTEGAGFWELTGDQGEQQGRLKKEADKQGHFSQI